MTLKDIVIVGGGIAGLYSAYKILQQDPARKLVVLEKNSKRWLGGRMNNEMFHGVRIVTGAGVGRKKKDKLLMQLLRDLQVPFHEFVANKQIAPEILPSLDVLKTVAALKQEYKKQGLPRITFRQFALPMLGQKTYKLFLTTTGYTDFENEDAYETLFRYGFDDSVGGWTALSVPWHDLIQALAKAIGWNRIHVSENVSQIVPCQEGRGGFLVETMTSSGRMQRYQAQKVIVATTIEGVQALVPGANHPTSLYQTIHGQPFLRMYGKVDKKSDELLKQKVPVQTVVKGPLYKIIPFEKGVYMIAYNDNRGADYCRPYVQKTNHHLAFWEHQLEQALELPVRLLDTRGFYFPIGTHYYGPLPKGFDDRRQFIRQAQHPFPNMWVVGELISRNQGWTEGALESVEAIVHQL